MHTYHSKQLCSQVKFVQWANENFISGFKKCCSNLQSFPMINILLMKIPGHKKTAYSMQAEIFSVPETPSQARTNGTQSTAGIKVYLQSKVLPSGVVLPSNHGQSGSWRPGESWKKLGWQHSWLLWKWENCANSSPFCTKESTVHECKETSGSNPPPSISHSIYSLLLNKQL